jgi:hypothetical protein
VVYCEVMTKPLDGFKSLIAFGAECPLSVVLSINRLDAEEKNGVKNEHSCHDVSVTVITK